MNAADVVQALTTLIEKEVGSDHPAELYQCLSILRTWQRKMRPHSVLPGAPLCPNEALDAELVTEAYWFLRLATAAYGWMGMLYFQLTDPHNSVTDLSLRSLSAAVAAPFRGDVLAFARHAGIDAGDVVYESDAARVGTPKWYIARCHKTRSIVLAVRGTLSIADTLTDLVTRQVPFAFGGVAHEGMAMAAHAIYGAAVDMLEAELRRYPTYSLVFTGHSLGAGTAILLTLLCLRMQRLVPSAYSSSGSGNGSSTTNNNNGHGDNGGGGAKQLPSPSSLPLPSLAASSGRTVTCYAFAPPPVFAPVDKLSPQVSSCIRCWVHNNDLVPRLTLESVRDLIRVLRKIRDAEPSMLKRALKGVDVDAALADEVLLRREWVGTTAHRLAAAQGSAAGDAAAADVGAQHELIRGSVPLEGEVASSGLASPTSPDPYRPAGGGAAAEAAAAAGGGSGSDAPPAPAATAVMPVTPLLASTSGGMTSTGVGKSPAMRPAGTGSGANAAATAAAASRLQLPGTIYCFRAPVEVELPAPPAAAGAGARAGAAAATATGNVMGGGSAATLPLGAPGAISAAVTDGGEGAAGNPDAPAPAPPPSPPLTALLSSMSTLLSSAATGVTGAVSAVANAVATTLAPPPAGNPAAADGAEGDGQDGSSSLRPDVAAAARRASLPGRSMPFLTRCTTADLLQIPVTDSAWGDHVPSSYLVAMRQLKEVADSQGPGVGCSAQPPGTPSAATSASGGEGNGSATTNGGGGGAAYRPAATSDCLASDLDGLGALPPPAVTTTSSTSSATSLTAAASASSAPASAGRGILSQPLGPPARFTFTAAAAPPSSAASRPPLPLLPPSPSVAGGRTLSRTPSTFATSLTDLQEAAGSDKEGEEEEDGQGNAQDEAAEDGPALQLQLPPTLEEASP